MLQDHHGLAFSTGAMWTRRLPLLPCARPQDLYYDCEEDEPPDLLGDLGSYVYEAGRNRRDGAASTFGSGGARDDRHFGWPKENHRKENSKFHMLRENDPVPALCHGDELLPWEELHGNPHGLPGDPSISSTTRTWGPQEVGSPTEDDDAPGVPPRNSGGLPGDPSRNLGGIPGDPHCNPGGLSGDPSTFSATRTGLLVTRS